MHDPLIFVQTDWRYHEFWCYNECRYNEDSLYHNVFSQYGNVFLKAP